MTAGFEKVRAVAKRFFDEELKFLAKNSSWVFASNLLGAILGFARAILLARFLGVEIFGIYTIIVTFVSTVLELFNLNISTAIIKFGAKFKSDGEHEKLSALIKGAILASGIATIVAIIAISLLLVSGYHLFFTIEKLEWYCVIYAVVAGFYLFANTINYGILALHFNFKKNAVITVVNDVTEVLFILVALLFFTDNFLIFFTAIIISKLLNGIISLLSLIQETQTHFRDIKSTSLNIIGAQWKEIKSFIFNNSVSASVKTFINKGDVLLLGFTGTPAMVSFYSIAKKLAYSVLTITDPLQASIYPQLSRLVAEKKFFETKKMLKKITVMLLFPSVIILGIIYLLREWIIVTVFGSSYAPAAEPFFYLMCVSLMISVFFWNLSMIQSLGLVQFRLIIYLVALIIGGTCSYFLILKYEARGAAIGLFISYTIITASFTAKAFNKLNRLIKQG